MAKKKQAVKKTGGTKKGGMYCPTKGALVFRGIIAIMLGLILWFGYLNLTQAFAVVLILVGIKKLFYSSHC